MEGPGDASPAADLQEPLAYRRDFWDRPDGDWGMEPLAGEEALERRRHANICYMMGSQALARGDLNIAESRLGVATGEQHPGAWFRYAVVVLRMGPRVFGGDGAHAWLCFLVNSAADAGHKDAERLLPLLRDPSAELPSCGDGDWDDPEFGPEILAALRQPVTWRRPPEPPVGETLSGATG
ncbi:MULTISPECIES: hypothetical protein [unclassified Streptomyces]|uniref:hypothetical protein n=1 Tax=unclassified Streptomyces TaxID=2593676 RepID=UPI00365363BB